MPVEHSPSGCVGSSPTADTGYPARRTLERGESAKLSALAWKNGRAVMQRFAKSYIEQSMRRFESYFFRYEKETEDYD